MANIPLVIVDDSEEDRYLVKRHLQRFGGFSPVLEADTGFEFLESFIDNSVNQRIGASPLVVLMDINMPGIDGFETVAALEQKMANGTAPESIVIMMLTSSDNPYDRARAAKRPAIKGFIVKPLDETGIATILTIYASAR